MGRTSFASTSKKHLWEQGNITMSNNLYYREIADRMSNRLFQNPEEMDQIDEVISEYNDDSTVYSICAKAADVLDIVKELSNDDHIDWDNAVDEYADEVIDHLLEGQRLDTLDMISMASKSGQSLK